jgi:tetratricopeptide (TPR) repeat protein
MMRPRRFELYAQLVQQAGDFDDALALAFAERALREVPPRSERSAQDAMVLGAAGRALAAAGELGRAAEVLDEAIETWRALQEGEQVSYALCERARLAGLAGDGAALARCEWVAKELREASARSRAYLRLALGRGWMGCGERERAYALVEKGAPEVDRHVDGSLARWRAHAARATGRQVGAVEGSPWRELAALDAALAAGGDGWGELEALAGVAGVAREVARVRARCPAGWSEGVWVAEQFRY